MTDAPRANVVVDRRAGGIATITLDRAQKLNALDGDTLRELRTVLDGLAAEPDVRVLLITGGGEKAFSAGADIAAMAAMAPAEGHAYAELGHAVMAAVEAFPVPVVGVLNGVALGGGLELALACDLLIASSRARLGQPEINLGLIPGFGGTQRLVRRIGLTRARELIYLGQAISADDALRMGLVTRVVQPETLPAEAQGLAEELARKPPLALRQAKRATAVAAETDTATGCRYEVEAFAVTFASDDRVEGLRAFLDKRSPGWRGR
jgi:enoyl-CoA hydratase